jgi:hypothetical protein
MFRTFGRDLPKIEQEIRALCEGWHPLFEDEEKVVLDGSDGMTDYRMCFDSKAYCGTFFRNPLKDEIALVMGTIEQPKINECWREFYAKIPGVQIFEGPEAVYAHYDSLGAQCGTVALRDYYQAWNSVENMSHGGKPFFLGCLNDPERHSIFFDDHITAANPKIVDPIDAHFWPRRFSSSQLYGVHLMQAQPLRSIRESNYFVDCVSSCEAARSEKLARWQMLLNLSRRPRRCAAGADHPREGPERKRDAAENRHEQDRLQTLGNEQSGPISIDGCHLRQFLMRHCDFA